MTSGGFGGFGAFGVAVTSSPPAFGASATSLFGTSTPTTSTSTTATPLFTLPLTSSTVGATDKAAKKLEYTFGQKLHLTKEKNNVPEEGSSLPKAPAPWRSVEWTEEERSSLLGRLTSYTPSSRDVPQARVLLLGPVGSGKSSFISSVQSVLDGRVTTRAMVGHSASSSFTRKLQAFPLRARDSDRGQGRSTALVLCDMMGFGDGTLNGPTLQHMLSVVKGHAPDGYKFRVDEALSSDSEGFIKRPGLRGQMHCVAFVLDASKVRSDSYSKADCGTFRLLRRFISDMEVHQVVLLTHIDQICPETTKDTSEVYRSFFVRETMFRAAELVGISVSSVVPVRNYSCELDLDLSSDLLLLRAMDHILQYTELLLTEDRVSSPARDEH